MIMEPTMNQRYHVVFTGKEVTTRRLWKGPLVEKYSSAGRFEDGKQVVSAMFGRHEIRQFLEAEVVGEFSVATINDPIIARTILEQGCEITDPDTQEKSHWYAGAYYVRGDEDVTYIMLRDKAKADLMMDLLHLHIDMCGKKTNGVKVGKYMKRLFSHHRKVIRGTVVSKGDGDVIIVKLDNGKAIAVRYADHGAITDGMNLVSTHCMKMLGMRSKVGAGLRITALSPKGFSKGHAIVLDHLKFDLVLFNSKKLLKGDRFFLAVDWLHAGRVFTDSQSKTNFRYHKFLYPWAEKFMGEVMDALPDERKLRRMFNFYDVEFHRYRQGEENEGEYIEKEKDWSLLRALRQGVEIRPHPALVRKVFHLFIDKIMNCETKSRVPVPAEVGGAKYALVDPTIFDSWGNPTMHGELEGNTVYIPDHSGDIVFHRQPNGHRGEHHIAKAVQNKQLQALDTGCFIFISKDVVASSLLKLGGGDQDDRLVFYKDPSVVEHFRMLPPYPVIEFPAVEEHERRENTFADRLRPAKYDELLLLIMLEMMKKQRVSIGQIVNPLLHDASLSDHKEAIITWMVNNLPKTAHHLEDIEWMKAYKPNTLSGVASRLELFIDSVKKDGGDRSDMAKEVKQYNQTMRVVCEYNKGRVTSSRQGANHPTIVRCPIDDSMSKIAQMRADMEDTVIELTWEWLRPIPYEILTQPTMEGSEELAKAIRSYYGQLWAEANKGSIPSHDKEEVKKRISKYIEIDELVAKRFGNHPCVVDAFVHLYRMVYDNRKPEAPRDPETDRPETYRDGILWGPRLSAYTMKALELCGLAGRYAKVDLYEGMERYAKEENLDAISDEGVVSTADGSVQFGMVDPSPNGRVNTKVEKGWMFVPARDAYSYEPSAKMIALDVVAGLQEKGAAQEEIEAWKRHAHEHVKLVPYLFGVDKEHAVKLVLDDGTEFGHITRKDNSYVRAEQDGWLALNPDKSKKYAMLVIIKE
jgi:DNA-directed RNA polymerase alpha subunit